MESRPRAGLALIDDPAHAGVQRLVADLNKIYRCEPALHRRDCDPSGFHWTVGDDRSNSVFAFFRLAPDAPTVLVVSNMTPVPRHDTGSACRMAGGGGKSSIAIPVLTADRTSAMTEG